MVMPLVLIRRICAQCRRIEVPGGIFPGRSVGGSGAFREDAAEVWNVEVGTGPTESRPKNGEKPCVSGS